VKSNQVCRATWGNISIATTAILMRWLWWRLPMSWLVSWQDTKLDPLARFHVESCGVLGDLEYPFHYKHSQFHFGPKRYFHVKVLSMSLMILCGFVTVTRLFPNNVQVLECRCNLNMLLVALDPSLPLGSSAIRQRRWSWLNAELLRHPTLFLVQDPLLK